MVPLSIDGSVIANSFSDNITVNIILLILLVFLLIASAFFSSAETAYSTVNIIRLKNYQDERKKGAKKAVYIAEKFDFTLTTILIGNNFVNIASTTIAAYILSQLIANPTIYNIINTIGMTIIVLIFGEIMPKTLAKENAEKIALRYSGALYLIMKIFTPFTYLFMLIRKLVKKHKKEEASPYMTEQELESIVDVMEGQGVIDQDDASLISNALNLGDRTAYDIMTPRVDMIAADIDDPIEEILDLFIKYQFSRIPIYDDDKDNIVGVLKEKDFFANYIKNEEKFSIKKLLSKPYYVTKSTKVDDLIREMQQLKKHFAIVTDEYGGTSGIVTMEDALEELVGEIYDEEDDVEVHDIIEAKPGVYQLSADIELEDLFEQLKLGKVPETTYTNVGGFVYDICDGVPEVGQKVSIKSIYEEIDLENPVFIEYNLTFEIKKMEKRRIKSLVLYVTDLTAKKAEQNEKTEREGK